ncbi:uncharacterized protein LOC143296356 [Babylonia areolata]|uniref:uncharacterized protein LOC143296356 n=1 Tax=Babylonia areolata TaxID=304850 RepID=UPI003FD64681
MTMGFVNCMVASLMAPLMVIISGAPCQPPWLFLNRTCYLFDVSKPRSWHEARAFCQAEGGDLLSISSFAQQRRTMRKLHDSKYVWWVGLQKHNGSEWRWVDGSPLDIRITRWERDQPDNVSGNDCGTVNFREKLGDSACSFQQPFICEETSGKTAITPWTEQLPLEQATSPTAGLTRATPATKSAFTSTTPSAFTMAAPTTPSTFTTAAPTTPSAFTTAAPTTPSTFTTAAPTTPSTFTTAAPTTPSTFTTAAPTTPSTFTTAAPTTPSTFTMAAPTTPSTFTMAAPTTPSTFTTAAPTTPSAFTTAAPTTPSTFTTAAPTKPSTFTTAAPTKPSTFTTAAPTTPSAFTMAAPTTPSAFTTAVQGATCQPPWLFLNRACYLFDVSKRRSWHEAREFCQTEGGDLLSISSVKEYRIIRDNLHDSAPLWWTGLHNQNGCRWRWVDGRPFTRITPWESVQPDYYVGDGDCAALNLKGKVSDIACRNLLAVICEGKPAPTTVRALTESNKTRILRQLAQEEASTETVAHTAAVMEEPGDTSAADVVEVADIVDRALQLPSVSAQMATNILRIVDSVSAVNKSVLQQSITKGNTTNRIIFAVERLADKVSLQDGLARVETKGIILQVWNLTTTILAQSPVLGWQVDSSGDTGRLTSASHLAEDPHMDSAIMLSEGTARRIVNGTATEAFSGRDVRVSFNVIKQTGLFQAGGHTDTNTSDAHATQGGPTARDSLNSKVLSLRITVDGQPVTDLSAFGQGYVTTVFQSLESLSPRLQSERKERTQCVFWDFALRQSLGGWSTEGCHLERFVSGRVTCVCDHLTNFAVLMDMYDQGTEEAHMEALGLLTTAGLSLSICGLAVTALLFILVKAQHRSLPQQTLFNMALAMLLSWVTFLAGVRRRVGEEEHHHHVACLLVAMLLHYLLLVSFLWMLAQAALHYLLLVKASKRPFFTHYMLKAAPLAWGLPLLPVIIVSAVDVELYHGGKDYCWMSLTAFYCAFLPPLAVIITTNIIIYVLVVVGICRRPSVKSGSSYTAIGVRASISCFVVFGLSWTFAFFAVGEARALFQYLFTITSTSQGLLIFILYPARDPAVRTYLRDKLHSCRRGRKDVHTSSTPQATPGTQRQENIQETSFSRPGQKRW